MEKLGAKVAAAAALPAGPEFPFEVEHLWRYFIEHSLGMAATGMGPPLVTWEGLAAWCGLTGIELEPWEALALTRIGHARAVILSESKPQQHGPQDQDRPGGAGDRRNRPR